MRELAAAAAVAIVPASFVVWLAVHHQPPAVVGALVGAFAGVPVALAIDVARRRRRSSSSSRCARCQRLADMPSAPCPACPDA